MTSPLARLAAFAVVLVLAGAGAAAVGSIVGDDVDVDAVTTQAEGHGTTADDIGGAGHDEAPAGDAHDDEAASAHGAQDGTTTAALPGLAVAQSGTRLALHTTTVARPGPTTIAFSILDDAGRPIRRFDLAHERRMHLVLVRRDLRGFQHLHPTMGADGTWRITTRLPLAGTYRVFADFTRDGEQRTLGADLQVGGRVVPQAVPAAATVARSDRGAEVRLHRDGANVDFEVRRGGRVVDTELEPYLGAKGHLVSLRVGDLAYLHTHPDGDRLAFESEFPSAGRYRLWVQFRLDGVVHTAAFTQEQPS